MVGRLPAMQVEFPPISVHDLRFDHGIVTCLTEAIAVTTIFAMLFHRFVSVLPAVLSFIISATLSAAEDRQAPAPVGRSEESTLDYARELMAQRKYAEAEKELEKIVRADEQAHGPQDEQTLTHRLEHAIARGEAGG